MPEPLKAQVISLLPKHDARPIDETMGGNRSAEELQPTHVQEQQAGTSKRVCTNAQTHMRWFQCPSTLCWNLKWQEAKGDGDCFWYSLAALTGMPWKHLKDTALAHLPEVKNQWEVVFPTGLAGWEDFAAQLHLPSEFATEAAVAAASRALNRALMIVGDTVASLVQWSDDAMIDWTQVVVMRLHSEHYTPMAPDSKIPAQVHGQMTVIAQDKQPRLKGGFVSDCNQLSGAKLGTLNCNSLDRHVPTIMALPCDVVWLQETWATARALKRIQYTLRAHDWHVIWGKECPLMQNRRGQFRANRGQVPGVCDMFQKHCAHGWCLAPHS